MSIATLSDVESLERVPVAQRLAAGSTLGLLRESAARHGDRIALRFMASAEPGAPVADLTYAAFLRRVVQAANFFRSLGAGEGDAVSSLLPLSTETFVAAFGAQCAAAANPINFLLEPEQIAAILREARCRVLLAPDPDLLPGIWEKVEGIAASVPTLQTVVRVGGPAERPGSDAPHFESELDRQAPELAFERAIGPDDVAALFHTGGTTSTPKLARHSHGGLLLGAWTNAQIWELEADDILFNGLPLFHVGGMNCAGLAPLSRGASIVLLTPTGYRNASVVADFWRLVERFRPTVIGMVPTSWGAVMNVPSDGCDTSSIRLCNAGAAALPVELGRAVERRLGVPMVEGWGMTELHGFGTASPSAGVRRFGSVGTRVPYLEVVVAIVKERRIERLCEPDEIGRVLTRGRQVFGGYVDPAHDASTWIEPLASDDVPPWSPGGRWLDTGDLGRLDADGYLWLTGRAKDLIIRSAHNIDPLTIEQALYAHPEVELAAAIGRPDAYAGELPVCFVQRKAGATVSAEELREFARERIPERAAVPVEITIVESMPLTGVGKIFKPALRHAAAQRVFERLLQGLLAGKHATFDVSISAHPLHGSVALIELDANAGEDVVAAVRAELDRFTLRYELTTRAAR
jgi:fatty-acyl-CoA synthase